MGLASNATGRLHISVLSKIKQVNWTPKHNQGKIYTLYSMIALWSKAEKKTLSHGKKNIFQVREDINRKKRFLSGIARMREGGVYPCLDFLAPFFAK